MSEARSILLIVPNWVGDVVMATPAIRAIRRQFPLADIVALALQSAASVLADNPHINEFIVANRAGFGPQTRNRRELIALLRSHKFDVAVVFPNSFRTAWLAWRSGARRRVGYAVQWRSMLLTDRVPPPRENGRIVPINMVDRYLALAAKLGCTDLSKAEELFASSADAAAAREKLKSLGIADTDKLAVLIPGAAFGPAKLWGAEKFAAVADHFAAQGFKVLAHIGPGESQVGEQLAAASRNVVIASPGTLDLRTLKPVISRAAIVVANDTGPRHYAVAYNVPNVAILGPTSPRYISVNLERTRIVQASVDCGPCQQKVCTKDHRCMTKITPAEIITAAESLLLGQSDDTSK